MGLPEEFDYNTTTATFPAATNNFRINTDNQMYGAQVGGMLEFYCDNRWWFNFEFKGGVMDDRTSLTTLYQNTPVGGATTNTAFTTQQDHTAFVEDFSITCVYHWNEHITTRFGWQGVFLQNVALAEQNLGTSLPLLTTGPAVLNHYGSVVYQGPVAGLTVAW